MSELASSDQSSTKSSKKKRSKSSRRISNDSRRSERSRRHHRRKSQSKSRSRHHRRPKELVLPHAEDANPQTSCANCLTGIFVAQLMVLTITVIACGLAAFYSTESMLDFFFILIGLHVEYLFATFFACCYSNRHIIAFMCLNAFLVVAVEAGCEIYMTIVDLKGKCQRDGCGFVVSQFNHRLY
uniref:Uncharacterized protein n=1 Tax=Panagrolaimus sp. JU765 TaxID=591449 RepID=A0AC34QL82_9BILA